MRNRPLLAINLLFLHSRLAGIRKYALHLIPSLIELNETFEMVLLIANGSDVTDVLRSKIESATGHSENVQILTLPCSPVRKVSMFFVENTVLPHILKRLDVQLLVSLDYHGPVFTRVPQAITVHDLKVCDLPDTFSWSQRLTRQLLFPLLARRVAQVWTISRYSAERIGTHFPAAASKVRIIGSGVDLNGRAHTDLEAARGSGEPYFLSVGTFTRHKNHVMLLRAFLDHAGPERLMLVGARGPALRDPELQSLLDAAGHRVAVHHDVTDDELQAMFRGAKGYLTTSLYEGFGMTVLEAMRYGVPVACSNVAALPEVAGNAALTFNPRDLRAVTAAMDALSSDAVLRAKLVKRGCARVSQFDWSLAAERALDACRELLGSHHPGTKCRPQ